MTLAGCIIYNQNYEAREVKYYAALNTENLWLTYIIWSYYTGKYWIILHHTGKN